MEVLKTNDLLIGYGNKAILPPINITLNEGDLVALIGPMVRENQRFLKL